MLSFLIILAAALLSSVLALPTIETKGAKFFTSEGNQWYIKGLSMILKTFLHMLLTRSPQASPTSSPQRIHLLKDPNASSMPA